MDDVDGCPTERCSTCKENDHNLYYAGEFLEAILKQLYSRDLLDLPVLEDDLEELSSYLHIKIPNSQIQITRSK